MTGASRGIGEAVALMMAEQGADVAINFRSKGSRAEEIANQVQALGRRALLAQADLTDQSSVEAMAREVDRVAADAKHWKHRLRHQPSGAFLRPQARAWRL